TDDALLQVYLFDSAQLELVRRTPDQAALINEALIGDTDLGGPQRQHDHREQHNACQYQAADNFASGLRSSGRARRQQETQQQRPGHSRINPGKMRPIEKPPAAAKAVLDVAHASPQGFHNPIASITRPKLERSPMRQTSRWQTTDVAKRRRLFMRQRPGAAGPAFDRVRRVRLPLRSSDRL